MDRDDAAPATNGRPRRRTVALIAGAAVLVLAVVVALALSRGGDEGDPGTGAATAPTGTASSAPAAEPDGGASTGQGPDDGQADDELPASGPDAQEAPPVGLDASPAVAPGVTLRVKGVTAVDGAASLPGEVSGPAVRVELELANTSGAPVDLAATVVGLAYGPDRIPANTFSTGTSSLVGSVDTGSSATGVYVFAVPADDQATLRISVDYAVGVPVVVFEGSAS